MRHKVPIGSAILFALLVISIPVLLPMIRRAEIARRAEEDYQRFVKTGNTEVYTYYPELLDRIRSDDQLASQITIVHLSSLRSDEDYSSLIHLQNVEVLEVTYANDVSMIVPSINQMPSLKQAIFYYCDSGWLSKLKNPKLETLKIHGYQKGFVSDEVLKFCQENLPNCKIIVTSDED